MSFLVILISLTINYLWLKDFDRFDDSWFFRLRCRIEAFTESLQSEQLRWLAALLLIYGVPLLVLLLLMLVAEDRLAGLATMALHILVLLVALDRTQPGRLAKEFLERWNDGDDEACAVYLREDLQLLTGDAPSSCSELSEFFSQHIVYLFFERMFVMFFWYMLTGPVGILIAYITYQLRDSHRDVTPQALIELVRLLISILEWLPIRLVALTFCLAGNFVRCFESLRQALWVFDRNADTPAMLYDFAKRALAGLVTDDTEEAETEEGEAGAAEVPSERVQTAREIAALLGLLERSQAIWLVALAAITVFAI